MTEIRVLDTYCLDKRVPVRGRKLEAKEGNFIAGTSLDKRVPVRGRKQAITSSTVR